MLKVDIVSPAGTTIDSAKAASVKMTTETGEIVVLPGHVNLLTVLGKGVLVLAPESGESQKYVVCKGFAEVNNGETVVIAAEKVAKVDSLNKEELETAKRDIEAKISSHTDTASSDFAVLKEQLEDVVISLNAYESNGKN